MTTMDPASVTDVLLRRGLRVVSHFFSIAKTISTRNIFSKTAF
jgi:hypothetical protein